MLGSGQAGRVWLRQRKENDREEALCYLAVALQGHLARAELSCK